MRNLKINLSLISILSLFIGGCGLFSIMADSFHRAGVTDDSRQGLLMEKVKDYQNGLYWGKQSEILAYVDEDNRKDVLIELRKFQQSGNKVVDSKIENVDFGPDSRTADVFLDIKYYKVPVYVVSDRVEKQKWEFSTGGGWKLVGITEDIRIDGANIAYSP